MLIIAFMFIGIVIGILLGVGLTFYYVKGEFFAYEEEINYLKKLNEEYRKASDDYIRDLTILNNDLKKKQLNKH